MSRLKLFTPDELSLDTVARDADLLPETGDDYIIPFRRQRLPEGRDSMLDVLMRAQLIRANRNCPDCDRTDVEPVELNDALHNRSGLPIPGSATLVGFRCNCCSAEWPV